MVCPNVGEHLSKGRKTHDFLKIALHIINKYKSDKCGVHLHSPLISSEQKERKKERKHTERIKRQNQKEKDRKEQTIEQMKQTKE